MEKEKQSRRRRRGHEEAAMRADGSEAPRRDSNGEQHRTLG